MKKLKIRNNASIPPFLLSSLHLSPVPTSLFFSVLFLHLSSYRIYMYASSYLPLRSYTSFFRLLPLISPSRIPSFLNSISIVFLLFLSLIFLPVPLSGRCTS